MEPLSTTEIDALRETQESSMFSRVNLHRRVVGEDEFGDETYTEAVTSNVPCGFKFTGGIVSIGGGSWVKVEYDAIMRLAFDTAALDTNDQVELVQHMGETISIMFDVYSYRLLTHAAVYQLKRRGGGA